MRKVEVELGALGLLVNCPHCGVRLYIPTEDISATERKLGEKLIRCDNCGKRFTVLIKEEEGRKENE